MNNDTIIIIINKILNFVILLVEDIQKITQDLMFMFMIS